MSSGMTVIPIIEFRQYRLHPGARETLVELFEAEFIESQEECGMTVIGQFRDLDDPDRFSWLRGFPSMDARPGALGRFYEGPVWAANRDAANATMINSDDVHLLRPTNGNGRFAVDPARRPGPDSTIDEKAVHLVVLCTLKTGAEGAFLDAAAPVVNSALVGAGGEPLATLATLQAANNWPRLPVHEDQRIVMWLSRFRDRTAIDKAVAKLSGREEWRTVADFLIKPAEFRRLAPTRRSALR